MIERQFAYVRGRLTRPWDIYTELAYLLWQARRVIR